MTATIRADLTLGTAYGLAASAVVWMLVLFPPGPTATDAMVLAFAAAAGAVATTFGGRMRLRPIYPVAVAALLLSGPFISCVAGCACAVAAAVHLPRVTRRGGRTTSKNLNLAPVGLRFSRTILACATAAGAFGLAGGRFGDPLAGGELILPVVAHAVTFAATRTLLVLLTTLGLGRRARVRALFRGLAVTVPSCIVGTSVGWAAAAGYAEASLRPLVLAGLALAATWAVHRMHARHSTTLRRHDTSMNYLRDNVTRALVRVMEERDPATQDQLRRVHRLCVGIGRSFDMSESELKTLESAALLHDIGKVSVPESILSKPGKLTPDEMERVKRHAITGSEIVQALPFRHSLAPLIRHHHERWDGDGYPDGLRGEQIPLGARILSAVDCYDALTSDRPYRKALTHREAATFLEREAGRMFDPDVVSALLDYLELRRPAAIAEPTARTVAEQREAAVPEEPAPTGSLAVAQRELETFYDIARAMSYGLNLEEFLTLAGCRLASLAPFQSMVVYFADHDAGLLRAHFAMGRSSEKLRLMTVPIGERLSGWAAAQQRAAVGRDHLSPLERDGSRSDLEDWADDPEVSSLRATLAAPLIAEAGLVGVVTLYDEIDRAFTDADRRILVRIAGYIAQAATLEGEENVVPQTTLTDPLTGVPNARFLWLESAHRMTQPEQGYALIAFRLRGLERVGEGQGNDTADRLLCEVARRFASGCRRSETLVRLGQDLFVVMTSAAESGELVRRWHELATVVEQAIPDPRTGEERQVRITASHASYPEDGTTLDALLEVLDRRMTLAARSGRTVIPFPSQPTSADALG